MTNQVRVPSMDVRLPPEDYQALVCGPGNTHLFLEVGQWLLDVLNHERMCEPGSRFLDIGCGCGRIARFLLPASIAAYIGFDRHEGMIDWCRVAIPDTRFTFDFFDLKSVYEQWDKTAGGIAADEFVFPYASTSVDSCLLASVFTHMPPGEARHYLSELGRVMRPKGKVLLSVFFSAGGTVETRDDGVNIFYDRDAFEADLRSSSFEGRLTGYSFTPGSRFSAAAIAPTPQFGYAHNWYVLTKR